MIVGLLDGIGVHGVGEHQKLPGRIAALFLPPADDLFAALDGRRAVGTEAGPVGDPVGGVAEERGGAEGVGQGDQQVAGIGVTPVVEHLIGRAAQFLVAAGERRQHHRQFVGVGADRLEVAVHCQQHVRGAGEGAPQSFLERLDAPALPQEAVPPPRAEVGDHQPVEPLQPLHLAPQLGLGAGVKHVEREAAAADHRRARAQLVDDGERRDLPHRSMGPRPPEVQLVLAIHLLQFVVGQVEVGEPGHELRREHLRLAVERVTGEPDQFLLGETKGAGVVELGAQFAFVDDVGETDVAAAVDHREGRMHARVERMNHLQHQELVEIGIEQAADDRVEPPAMVVGARRDVGHGHGGTIVWRPGARQGECQGECEGRCCRRTASVPRPAAWTARRRRAPSAALPRP